MSQASHQASSKAFKRSRAHGLAISGLVFYLVHILQQAQARDTAVLADTMTAHEGEVHQEGDTSDAITVASVETLEPAFIESTPSQLIETTLVVDEEETSEEVVNGKDAVDVSDGGVSPLLLLGGVALIGGGVAVLANDDDSNSNNDTEDSDPIIVPSISINDVTTTSEAEEEVAITVNLSNSSSEPVTVDYTTADGSATAGSDYTATSGTLTFAPGETSETFTVPILADDMYEGSDETITVTLSNVSGATLVDTSATLTIADDDSMPSVSIADVTTTSEAAENVTMTVTLSNSSSESVMVDYTTADGSATAGSDYTAVSGTLTFAPGETSQAFEVSVLSDEDNEENETITVTLSNVSGATLIDTSATLTITDDDISFTASDIATSADGARSVFVADMDGDGDMDIVSASFNDDTIAWYENDGAADTWIAADIAVSANGAQDVHVADMDGDGDLDIVSASVYDDTIAWYANDGTADPSWTAADITVSADGARSVFVADMDGDGDLDIVSASSFDDTIAWYENDGAAEPTWTAVDIATSADGAYNVFVADMDDDGDLDIVSASYYDNTIALYVNDLI